MECFECKDSTITATCCRHKKPVWSLCGAWRAEVVESMQRLRKDRSFILAEVKGLVLKSTVAQSVEYMNETHPHQLRGAAACVSVPLIPLIPLILLLGELIAFLSHQDPIWTRHKSQESRLSQDFSLFLTSIKL